MHVKHEYSLIETNLSAVVERALEEVRASIAEVVWPPGSGEFTIYPQSGKKSGEGNGVKPIKNDFVTHMQGLGWSAEMSFPLPSGVDDAGFGALDLGKTFPGAPPCGVEWETGNISSSHRAVNKMALGLATGALSLGVLIVPTSRLAAYLTDRIGNIRELRPYFPLWERVPVSSGNLRIIAIEHDAESMDVPKIPKGTDGRSLR